MKINEMKISKEQMLKITVALLIALSGIIVGIIELFSSCCCDKSTDDKVFLAKIILLGINVLAVLVTMCVDIKGIISYIKTQEVNTDSSNTIEENNKDESNGIFFFSLFSTAAAFFLLCCSVIAIFVINYIQYT